MSGDYGLALPSYTAATGAATQVQRGQEADRKLCNSWIRNGCQVDGSGNPVQSGGTSSPYIDAANFFDAASFVEVNASNVLTLNGGYWMVPTTQDQTGLVVSSATYDGSVSGNNATSGAAGTITITTAPWTAGNLSQPGQGGKVIRMTGGSQAGKVAVISLNSTNVIALYSPTLSGYTGAPGAPVNPFTAAPAPGDTFEIWKVVSADGIHPPEYGQGLIATGFAAHLAALYG